MTLLGRRGECEAIDGVLSEATAKPSAWKAIVNAVTSSWLRRSANVQAKVTYNKKARNPESRSPTL